MWTLSVFIHEAGVSYNEQIIAAKRAGLPRIDTRSIDSVNISVLPLENMRIIKNKLDKIGVSAYRCSARRLLKLNLSII